MIKGEQLEPKRLILIELTRWPPFAVLLCRFLKVFLSELLRGAVHTELHDTHPLLVVATWVGDMRDGQNEGNNSIVMEVDNDGAVRVDDMRDGQNEGNNSIVMEVGNDGAVRVDDMRDGQNEGNNSFVMEVGNDGAVRVDDMRDGQNEGNNSFVMEVGNDGAVRVDMP